MQNCNKLLFVLQITNRFCFGKSNFVSLIAVKKNKHKMLQVTKPGWVGKYVNKI